MSVKQQRAPIIYSLVLCWYLVLSVPVPASAIPIQSAKPHLTSPKYFVEQEERFRQGLVSLRIVQLDVDFITGYEFETRPALIMPHILKFLAEDSQRR